MEDKRKEEPVFRNKVAKPSMAPESANISNASFHSTTSITSKYNNFIRLPPKRIAARNREDERYNEKDLFTFSRQTDCQNTRNSFSVCTKNGNKFLLKSQKNLRER